MRYATVTAHRTRKARCASREVHLATMNVISSMPGPSAPNNSPHQDLIELPGVQLWPQRQVLQLLPPGLARQVIPSSRRHGCQDQVQPSDSRSGKIYQNRTPAPRPPQRDAGRHELTESGLASTSSSADRFWKRSVGKGSMASTGSSCTSCLSLSLSLSPSAYCPCFQCSGG